MHSSPMPWNVNRSILSLLKELIQIVLPSLCFDIFCLQENNQLTFQCFVEEQRLPRGEVHRSAI